MANSYGPQSTISDGLVFVCDPANTLCYTPGSTKIETLYSDELTGGPVSGSFKVDCYWNKIEWVCDGSGDWVEIQPFTTPGQALTVSTWAKCNNSTWNDHGFIASKRSSFIMHPSNGSTRVLFYVYTDAGTGNPQYTGATINQWNNWVGTYDGASAKLYLNGELKNTVSVTGTVVPDATGVMLIGGDDGYSRSINGQIGTVKIYNRGLSADEVIQDYEATKNRYQ